MSRGGGFVREAFGVRWAHTVGGMISASGLALTVAVQVFAASQRRQTKELV